MDKLCPICLREKDPHNIKCTRCKKLPIKVDLETEMYFGRMFTEQLLKQRGSTRL